MTITTTTRTRNAATSAAPRVNLRRSLFLQDPRREPRAAPSPTWIGTLIVPR